MPTTRQELLCQVSPSFEVVVIKTDGEQVTRYMRGADEAAVRKSLARKGNKWWLASVVSVSPDTRPFAFAR